MPIKRLITKELVFSAIEINKEFDRKYDNQVNMISSVFTGYTLRQTVRVESKDIKKVEDISYEVTELIRSGIEFQSFTLRYYYTKLLRLKHTMLEESSIATKERAEKIVEKAYKKLGDLKKAEVDIFQITEKIPTRITLTAAPSTL